MSHPLIRRSLLALALVATLVAGACSDDNGDLGQGAARVGGDDGGGTDVSVVTTTTTPSGAARDALVRQVLDRLLGDGKSASTPGADFARYRALADAGQGYDAILERATRDYVTQAFDRIFKYRNDPAFSPNSISRVPFSESVFQTVMNAVRGTGARRTLTLADGRVQPADGNGIWNFVAQSTRVWGTYRQDSPNAENCVGGMGPRCKGTTSWATSTPRPANVDVFTRMDGLQMNYIEMAVAVGSIIHDRSCVPSPLTTVYCNGESFPDGPTEGRISQPGVIPGELEWRKAAYNLRDGRFWAYRFGPYPLDGSQDPASATINHGGFRPNSPADFFRDDTRLMPGRPTRVTSTDVSPFDTNYTREEFAHTTVLFARPGTSLDPMDNRFCGSGNFARLDATPFTSWGVC